MQFIRQIIGQGDGEIVGCLDCGTVEHLIDNTVHVCNAGATPFAVTLDATKLTTSAEPAL